MAHARILLTGFGPFPDVPENASAWLVNRLASHLRASDLPAEIHTAILPVDWHRGPHRVQRLLARVKPHIALHFGVSGAARGFVIEQRARNACAALPDATGALPECTHVEPQGPRIRFVALPVPEIVAALRGLKLPVTRSKDAGAYLCNAVLYTSLASSVASRNHAVTGFIHIPAVIGPDGPLSQDDALRGGLAILAACVQAREGCKNFC